MAPHYEISVALNRYHLFTTDRLSVPSASTIRSLCDLFARKFPVTEGYLVEVTKVTEASRHRLDEAAIEAEGRQQAMSR